ncbi:hypothetical protein C7B63_11135 [Bacillus halotolerans]|nr:hypothetical protein C7B63_11135 [Bacillus halotolerans]PRP55229.1 hypothetical protein C7B71_09600 [Bacillus halotolerans]PRP59333.1 hypothetical protein C7B66_09660 [Bacillus halotolerans]PRP63998.1 hypothetical protein C7B72_09655 [Bacillus halotolerans]
MSPPLFYGKTVRHSLNLYGLFISFSYLFFTIRHHKEVKNDENQTFRHSPYCYFACSGFSQHLSHLAG